MSLDVPVLDDVDFDALVDEARALIPKYAPEWTDHNVHDPGIMLLELLAWLVDQQVYHAGFVGDRHVDAFAALLGVRRQRAKPARGLVWPDPDALDGTRGARGVTLPAGTRVTCLQQPDTILELEHAVCLTAAKPTTDDAAIGPRAGGIVIQTRALRAAVTLTDPRDPCGAVELRFDRPLVTGTATEPIAIGVQLEGDASASNVLPDGDVAVDYRVGDGPWRPLRVVHDGTHGLEASGVVIVAVPGVADDGRVRLRLYAPKRVNPLPPRILEVALNVLPVVQRETRAAGPLSPPCNGLPDQTYDILLDGLIGELIIRVDGEPWKATTDLNAKGPNDRVVMIRTDLGQIVFGNGVNGRIPPPGSQVLFDAFAVTRGRSGNLPIDLSFAVAGVLSQSTQGRFGRNVQPIDGAEDAWDTTRLVREMQARVNRRRALVTDAELDGTVRSLAGFSVANLKILPNVHPALPGRTLAGIRSIVVTPQRAPGTSALMPVPPAYAAGVARALASRRVLGERLVVLAAERIAVAVEAELLTDAGYDARTIEAAARARLNARLSDVSVQPDVEPWPPGRPVTPAEMQTLLSRVEGVIAVRSLRLIGERVDRHGVVLLAPHEIAVGGPHRIRATVAGEAS